MRIKNFFQDCGRGIFGKTGDTMRMHYGQCGADPEGNGNSLKIMADLNGRESMKTEQLFHDVMSTRFGSIAIVWWNAPAGPRIRQIFLCGQNPAVKVIQEKYPGTRLQSAAEIDALVRQMQRFLEGHDVVFDLGMMAMDVCGEFQRKVLMTEYGIPRGWVSTYGRIAAYVGAEGGGRAAGQALAQNPFPIVVPCHRAVRANGEIGGYQGGSGMKHALLEMEGVKFSGEGRVTMNKVYYT